MSEQVQGRPEPPGAPAEAPVQTSGLAIASLVLALFFFVPFAPLLGLVFGIIALSQISYSNGRLTGKGLAVAGVAIGGLVTLIMCMMVVWLSMSLLALPSPRHRARMMSCKANLRGLGFAIGLYRADYDNHLPPDLETLVTLEYLNLGLNERDKEAGMQFYGTMLSCPQGGEPIDTSDIDGTASYYYARLKSPQDVHPPPRTPIVWERKTWHGPEAVNLLAMDLSVSWMSLEELAQHLEHLQDLYEKPPEMPEVIRR